MIRRLAQLFSLGLFIVLLGLAASSPQPEQGLALYLGLDPLNALLVPLLDKSWVLLPGLLVALLTVIGGRWFCAWLCPLGGTLDLTDRLINPQKAASAGRKLRGFKLGFLDRKSVV